MDNTLIPTTEGQRLLVVDDEASILGIVKTILTKAQYTVTTCETVAEALKFLHHEPFDCLITDAIMPLATGYDLIKSIREGCSHKDIPILMLTRKRNRQDVKKALEVGVTDYVLKPIDEHLFLDKVEICLRKGEGKRHIIECTLHGDQSNGALLVACKISAISESYLTCIVSLPIPAELQCEMNAPIFDDIGITPPITKLISCVKAPPQTGENHNYIAKFSFVGVPEPELRKIRTWLNREEMRRRK